MTGLFVWLAANPIPGAILLVALVLVLICCAGLFPGA